MTAYPVQIVLATQNRHKLNEITAILCDLPVTLSSLYDFPEIGEIEETGSTVEENALIKATSIYALTGLPTFGDDTGLMVDALDGRPGIYSARYAGPEATYAQNNEKLLKALKDVPELDRTASFQCAIAFACPKEMLDLIKMPRNEGYEVQGYTTTDVRHSLTVLMRGEVNGTIITECRGMEGFGYDPLFYVHELEKTFAELTLEQKNELSHRSKATRKFKRLLETCMKF